MGLALEEAALRARGNSIRRAAGGCSGHEKGDRGTFEERPAFRKGYSQETDMRDVAVSTMVSTARLTRELDERECRQRNALSQTIPGFALRSGDVGTVLETLGNNEAFLVEFNRDGKARTANATGSVCSIRPRSRRWIAPKRFGEGVRPLTSTLE